MRHKKAGRKLGRNSTQREALMLGLLNSIVKYERVKTTVTRAKELRIIAERVVTLAKKNTQASITQLTKYIKSERELLITKLLKELAPRFAARNGGYTRIIKVGARRGDAAPTAIIEYLPDGKPEVKAEESK
jgi:large subunit ribosomal protein L17